MYSPSHKVFSQEDALICCLKVDEEVKCIFTVFTSFCKYLTYGENVVNSRLPPTTITTLVISSGNLYVGSEPIKQNVGEDLTGKT